MLHQGGELCHERGLQVLTVPTAFSAFVLFWTSAIMSMFLVP
jgi:hypothetical protein